MKKDKNTTTKKVAKAKATPVANTDKSKLKKQFTTDFWNRLLLFLKKRGDKLNFLTVQLNVSTSYFVHMIQTKGVMGTDVLAKLLKLYPELNAEWLLLGTGTMLKNSTIEDVSKYETRMTLHKEIRKKFTELEKVWEKIKDIEVELKK